MLDGFRRRLYYLQKGFPIELILYRKFNNTIKPVSYKARYEKRMDKSGTTPERYLTYRDGGFFGRSYYDIPYFHISNFEEVDGQQTIQLFEMALNDFHVAIWKEGMLYVYEKEYFVDERGVILKFAVDDKGVLKTDENGRWAIDMANGKPAVKAVVPKLVYDNTTTTLQGKKESMPVLLAKKTYDNEQFLGTEIMKANTMYNLTDFWSKWGSSIMAGVVCICLAISAYIVINATSELNQKTIAAQGELVKQMAGMVGEIAKMHGVTPVPTPTG